MDWFLLGGGAGLLAEVAEDAFSAPADLAGVGRQHPRMMRMAVVLPAPLGRRTRTSAEEVEAMGRHAVAVPTDVADPDQVEAAAQRIEDELGPIAV